LLYLDTYRPRVEKVFLIAAFSNDIQNSKRHDDGTAYANFFNEKIASERIKPLARQIIVMHSTDDDSIEFEQGKAIAEELNAQLITYNDRGHFSNERNAEEVFRVLKRELQF